MIVQKITVNVSENKSLNQTDMGPLFINLSISSILISVYLEILKVF